MVTLLVYFVFNLSFKYLCAVEGTPISAIVDSTNPDSFSLLVVGQGTAKPVKIIRNGQVTNGPPPGEQINKATVLIATENVNSIPRNDYIKLYDKKLHHYRSIPLKPYYDRIFYTPYKYVDPEWGDTLTGQVINDYYINVIDTNNVAVAITYEDTTKRELAKNSDYFTNEFTVSYIINLPTGRILKADNNEVPDLTPYGYYKYATGGDRIYVMTYDKLLIYRSRDMSKIREVSVPYLATDTTTCNVCYAWVYSSPDGRYIAIDSDTAIAIFDSTGELLHLYTPDSAEALLHYPHKKGGFSDIAPTHNDCFVLYGPYSTEKGLGYRPYRAIICPPDFSIKNYIEKPGMNLRVVLVDTFYNMVVCGSSSGGGDTIFIYYVEKGGELVDSTYRIFSGLYGKLRHPDGGVVIYPDYFFIRNPVYDSSYIYRIVR